MSGRTTNDVDRYIGARMRTLRKERGLSQQTLGSALCVSFQQIQKYEKGTNRIAAATLVEAAEYFKVSVTYFYPDSETDITETSNFLNSEFADPLIRAFNMVPDHIKKQVLDVVETMAYVKDTPETENQMPTI